MAAVTSSHSRSPQRETDQDRAGWSHYQDGCIIKADVHCVLSHAQPCYIQGNDSDFSDGVLSQSGEMVTSIIKTGLFSSWVHLNEKVGHEKFSFYCSLILRCSPSEW